MEVVEKIVSIIMVFPEIKFYHIYGGPFLNLEHFSLLYPPHRQVLGMRPILFLFEQMKAPLETWLVGSFWFADAPSLLCSALLQETDAPNKQAPGPGETPLVL
jgi:hypothetical protein